MLKSFYVRNFRNFKEGITINFADHGEYLFNNDCITDGVIGKMLIYGRNATGKSNLGSALMDAYFTLYRPYASSEPSFLNADSTEDVATFRYVMSFGKREVIYSYTKTDFPVLDTEELFVDGKSIYRIDFSQGFMEIDYAFLGANETIAQRYREEIVESRDNDDDQNRLLPFLRWLVSNVAIPEDSPVQQAWNFLRKMASLTNKGALRYPSRYMSSYWEYLSQGDNLKRYEAFLNIMGVPCCLAIERLPEGQYQLYFKHRKLVPYFQTASSGTLTLDELYRRIISREGVPSVLYFDEFDAHCHYEMADRLIQYFKLEYPQTQVIFTTHNTNLMTNRLLRPDCLFILSQNGKLTSLRNATHRELREGHNLEKMYISGEFQHYE